MKYFSIIFFIFLSLIADAKIVSVSKNGPIQKISDANPLLDHGDTLYIESGIYYNDKQVTFSKNNLLIKGLGTRPLLEAGEIIASDHTNGKGIFVIKGNDITIENLEFRNAKVPDYNGAGIRQEGRNLKIISCRFYQNEMGILCGSILNCKTTIEYCDFEGNGSLNNPGYQHNVYINHIDTLIFQFNNCIDATAEGHELKSRARYNYIGYNNISNYTTSDSRNIDLSNGGIAVIIGNVIEQAQSSVNSNIIGYGLEGLNNGEVNNLILVNNTIVNRKDKGSYVQIPSFGVDTLIQINNIFVGASTAYLVGNAEFTFDASNIKELNISALMFKDAMSFDYRLQASSIAVDSGFDLLSNNMFSTYHPLYEYTISGLVLPRQKISQLDIGAYEYPLTSLIDKNDNVIVLYPNPAHEEVFLSSDIQDGLYHITSSEGKTYEVFIVNNTINISALPNGLYAIVLNRNSYRFVRI